MTSSFNVHDAAGYEQLMGRWSQNSRPCSSNSRVLPTAKRFLMSAAALAA